MNWFGVFVIVSIFLTVPIYVGLSGVFPRCPRYIIIIIALAWPAFLAWAIVTR